MRGERKGEGEMEIELSSRFIEIYRMKLKTCLAEELLHPPFSLLFPIRSEILYTVKICELTFIIRT